MAKILYNRLGKWQIDTKLNCWVLPPFGSQILYVYTLFNKHHLSTTPSLTSLLHLILQKILMGIKSPSDERFQHFERYSRTDKERGMRHVYELFRLFSFFRLIPSKLYYSNQIFSRYRSVERQHLKYQSQITEEVLWTIWIL